MTVVTDRGSRTSRVERDWSDLGACRGAPSDLFFPEDLNGDEPAYPPPEVKRYCDRCRVRAQCLTEHLTEEFGIFGGKTGYERSLLTRPRQRKRCPGCSSLDLVIESRHEICLACGVSWEIF